MSWKKKLLLDVVVSVLVGAVVKELFLPWSDWQDVWGMFGFMAIWPFWNLLLWLKSVVENVFGGGWWVWLSNPLVWLPLAVVLVWLLVRQFRRSDRLSLWLGVAAVAGWWLSGLFWLCFVQALCD